MTSRFMMCWIVCGAVAVVSLTLAGCSPTGTPASAETPEGHFHPKGKAPSEHTTKIFEQARARLPFADKRDFEENEKGFIAAPDSMKIKAEAGAASVAAATGRRAIVTDPRRQPRPQKYVLAAGRRRG